MDPIISRATLGLLGLSGRTFFVGVAISHISRG